MHPRWSQGDAGSRLRAALPLAALLAALTLAAGCGHPAAKTASITRCGTTRTAANVPVKVEIIRGVESCQSAMSLEHRYSEEVAKGKAPGNGGGGPITIDGWKCQGFPTPEVLKTGKASKCVRGTTEILAILPPPS
jgi:hypothetical protein